MAAKIGIIGAGSVGKTLGGHLLRAGSSVQYGSRDPSSDKTKALLASQPGASADAVAATADWAEIIILATPSWDPAKQRQQIREAAAALGPGAAGKPLIDVINGLSAWPALALPWTGGPSSSEILQEALPDTPVYKAFSTVGVEQLAVPDGALLDSRRLTMLLAGPPEHRAAVEGVVAGVGFVPKYVGPLRYARNLDAIAELWIHLSIPGAGETPECWGRNFHFQVVEQTQ